EVVDGAGNVADVVELDAARSAFIVDVGAGRDQFLGLAPFARQDGFAGGVGDFTQGGGDAFTIGRAGLLDGQGQQEHGVVGVGHVGAVGVLANSAGEGVQRVEGRAGGRSSLGQDHAFERSRVTA